MLAQVEGSAERPIMPRLMGLEDMAVMEGYRKGTVMRFWLVGEHNLRTCASIYIYT